MKLWTTVKKPDGYRRLQNDLDRLADWSEKWLLPINIGKCAVLHLGSSEPGRTYKLRNTPIKRVQVEEDLGVLLSESLKTIQETNRKSAAATRLRWGIRRSFAALPPEAFQILYAAHVRPILEYGVPAY